MNVANLLTISRIVLTPIVVILLFSESQIGLLAAFILFLIASLTDFLDGQLARSYQIDSRLGKFLDPLADKILVVGTFLGLAFLIPYIVPWWAIVLIIARDAFVTGLRVWHESHNRSLKTFFVAKAKTSVQLVYLSLMLILLTGDKSSGYFHDLSSTILNSSIPWILMIFVVGFTVWTGLVYLVSSNAVTKTT